MSTAEQVLGRLPVAGTLNGPTPMVEARPAPVPQVSLRHAKSCLDHADRKLRRTPQAEQTDEVLHLLWAALGHIQTALDSERRSG